MNRPTWVTVVAIMGIVFSCWSLLGSGGMMMMPKLMQVQQRMIQNLEDNQSATRLPESSRTMFKEMMNFPPWFGTWSVIAGIVRILISAFGLYASVIMMQLKPNAVKCFYAAIGASIAFSVIHSVVSVAAVTLLGFWFLFAGFGGIMIDLVMIIVTAVNDKSAFRQTEATPAGAPVL